MFARLTKQIISLLVGGSFLRVDMYPTQTTRGFFYRVLQGFYLTKTYQQENRFVGCSISESCETNVVRAEMHLPHEGYYIVKKAFGDSKKDKSPRE